MGNCFKLCASSPEDDTLLPEHQDQDSSSPPTPVEVYAFGYNLLLFFILSPSVECTLFLSTQSKQCSLWVF